MTGIRSAKLRELVGRARDITATVVAANVEREEAEALWPGPAMRALAEAGLTGLFVPEDLGGHEEGITGLLAISEVLAQESPSVALCYAMHCVGTAVIASKANKHQREAYLEPIARGEHITTLALSEPGSGAHFYLPEAQLTRSGDDFIVDGTKSFVTNAGHADSYVISTRALDEEGAAGTFSCLLVDASAPGLRLEEPWLGIGMRSNSSRSMTLEGVRVPGRNLLGEEGDQQWYMFEVIAPYFLMAMAGTYVGVAGAALEIARAHLEGRRHTHSGELLGANPVVAHRLGDLWVRSEMTKQLVYAAAQKADVNDDEALLAVLASKAAAADAAVEIANEAMTLTGGIGYKHGGKLARMLHDARASHVMGPTTDMLKTWIGRGLLALPLI